MAKILTGENIDEINKFFMMHQNFPYQILLLANVALAQFINVFHHQKFALHSRDEPILPAKFLEK